MTASIPLWLVPALPLAGFLVNGLAGKKLGKSFVSAAGVGSVGLATVAASARLIPFFAGDHSAVVERIAPWFSAGGFSAELAMRLDPLSALMTSFVTFVGFWIHVYSVGYMRHDETEAGYARYFAYLNLFMFAMVILVLAQNFVLMFVGWEGVGLCSYLLIGYYYERQYAADAGKKAFIVNRIGDFGFLLGMFGLFSLFSSLDFDRVFSQAAAEPAKFAPYLTLVCLCLFLGAVGKSAQVPLFVWLPDAMAGPTPVSALIHAATMVTAGVYMVARCNVLFRLAPGAMAVVAVIGAVTAIFAGIIAVAQNDIKKVLAYSTVSQLGYMFLACGVGAYVAGMFHVLTHAFFKACLFLGSGSVSHAMGGEQDMRRMGNLKKYMPVTFATMMIGTLAIAGIFPLSGFFSKDEILFQAFLHNKAVWVLAVITAFMTAFYMFRLMSMTFFGGYRGPAWETAVHAAIAVAARHGAPHPADPHAHGQAHKKGHEVSHGPAEPHQSPVPSPQSHADDHSHAHGPWHVPHQSPTPITSPLMALAIGAIVAGLVGTPAALGGPNTIEHFLEPSFTAQHAEARGSTLSTSSGQAS